MADEHYIFSLSNKWPRTYDLQNRFITIAVDLYTPIDMDGNTRYPAVVIGPPYSGVKEQGPAYTPMNELAQAGFVALAFDPSYKQGRAAES